MCSEQVLQAVCGAGLTLATSVLLAVLPQAALGLRPSWARQQAVGGELLTKHTEQGCRAAGIPEPGDAELCSEVLCQYLPGPHATTPSLPPVPAPSERFLCGASLPFCAQCKQPVRCSACLWAVFHLREESCQHLCFHRASSSTGAAWKLLVFSFLLARSPPETMRDCAACWQLHPARLPLLRLATLRLVKASCFQQGLKCPERALTLHRPALRSAEPSAFESSWSRCPCSEMKLRCLRARGLL